MVIFEINNQIKTKKGLGNIFAQNRGRKNKRLDGLGTMYIDQNAQLVQTISNCVGYEAIKKGQYNNIWEFLILTSTFTEPSLSATAISPLTRPVAESRIPSITLSFKSVT